MRITAAVVAGPGKPFRLQEIDLAAPGPGEVLVRIVATGMCHTDFLAQLGKLPFALPGVLGHEGAGIIEQVGDLVSGLNPGDRVVLGWPHCGHCLACKRRQYRYCRDSAALLFGGTRLDGSPTLCHTDGSRLGGNFFGQSSFATYAVVAAGAVVPVPSGGSIPLAALGTLGCGFAAGAGAVLCSARPEPGASVAVFGAGAVGLAAVMATRLTAATSIVAIDRDPQRLRLAERLGATEIIDTTGVRNLARTVREACGGAVDYAIECTGDPKVIRQAVDSLGQLGVCVLVGTSELTAEFSVHQQTMLRGKRIQGSLGGDAPSELLVPSLLRLAEQGRFPFTELIEYLPFTEAEAAFDTIRQGGVVKPVLVMDQAAAGR